MIQLLLDNFRDKERLAFISKNLSFENSMILSPQCKSKIQSWLLGCKKVLCNSDSTDIIVCWYDFQAILCYWLGKVLCRQRKIICINLLLKDKKSIKNKLVAHLYKKALRDKHFIASVTSAEYGEHLKNRLRIKRKMFLLHDVFQESYVYGADVKVASKTVFCGGRNGRDWRFMVEVAKAMPHVKFHMVMPEAIFHEYEHELPNNAIARYNLPLDEFLKEMCSCEIVSLPLDTQAPAGLIVLFQAAANKKYIITTDTMTTREYLSDGRGCLLPNDVAAWTQAIAEKFGDNQANAEASDKLLSFLRNECSEKKFVEGIEKMIDKVQ